MNLPNKKSIKTVTLQSISIWVLLTALILLLVLGYSFRAFSQNSLKQRALGIAGLVGAGLTAHMKAEIMDKRAYFLDELNNIPEVNSLKIIRGPAVDNQFGPTLYNEQNPDSISHGVFKNKKPYFSLNEFKLNPVLKAVVPLVASDEGKLNCLECHKVEAGTVLGAVDLELNVKRQQYIAGLILLGILVLLVFLSIFLVLNTGRVLQRLVKSPLESLINTAWDSYKSRSFINTSDYESLEFETVAKEINQFNRQISRHQKLIHRKNEELQQLNEEVDNTLRETLFTMGLIEEKRSKETRFHTQRVTLYSRLLGELIELPVQELEVLTMAAPLHDIGKIGIPDYILLKPARLSKEEIKIMENHTRYGYLMLRHSKRDVLQAAATIAYEHHEKWDGSGYPRGLKEKEIHIYGRIVALADVFDALSSRRIYKEGWPREKVIDSISQSAGKHFDPQLVALLISHQQKFYEIQEQFKEDSEKLDG